MELITFIMTSIITSIMISIKNFDSSLLKLHKKSFKNISLNYIGYSAKKDEYTINGVNPLYLLVDEIDGFTEKKKEGSKYLNISLTDSNSEDQIQKINNGNLGEYGKDYMKIKFNSDDDLPLNKILKLRTLTIIIRSIFEEDGKYYSQSFLDDCLYEV